MILFILRKRSFDFDAGAEEHVLRAAGSERGWKKHHVRNPHGWQSAAKGPRINSQLLVIVEAAGHHEGNRVLLAERQDPRLLDRQALLLLMAKLSKSFIDSKIKIKKSFSVRSDQYYNYHCFTP